MQDTCLVGHSLSHSTMSIVVGEFSAVAAYHTQRKARIPRQWLRERTSPDRHRLAVLSICRVKVPALYHKTRAAAGVRSSSDRSSPDLRRMSLHRSLSVFGAVLGIALGCSATEGKPSGDDDRAPARELSRSVSPRDSLLGAADRARILVDSAAPMWVVIVSDFQCPFCKVWHDETFPALKREFVDSGRIRLAYLNLPLPQHQHARVTAELALCAGLQGRFWEYHDALFDTQANWSPLPAGTAYFDTLAARAGVDGGELKSCMDEQTMRGLVEADYQRSVASKVRSTPTFFIGNEIRLEGAQPITAFREAIERARRPAGQASGGGR